MKMPNLSLVSLLCAAISLSAPRAFATANYVYHEQTANDATGGNANTCGGPQIYVPVANPSSAQSYLFRFKVEYQFYTDTLRVYYTTDGTTPSGAFGAPGGTTQVVNGNYQCTFDFGGNTIDVCNATIPAQPAGTTVKYIIGAWHSGGGPEIFANSGTCLNCGDCESSTCATVFQYTVIPTARYWDVNGATAGASSSTTAAGTWDTGTTANWSTDSTGSSATIAWTAGEDAIFSAGANASGSFTVTIPSGTTNRANSVTVEEGTILLGPGTLNFGSVNGLFNIAAGATLNISGAGSGLVTGSGGITKSGPGTLSLGNANTYSGTTTIQTGGALKISNGTALGGTSQGTTVNSGGQLQTSTTLTGFAEPLTLNGTGINNDGTGALLITANGPTLAAAITLGSSGVRLQNNGAQATVSGGITGAGFDLTFGGTAGWVVGTQPINIGSGTLTKDGGSGTLLRLNTANTIGAVNLVSGGLNVGDAGCFGSGTITVGSGVGTPIDTGGILAGASLGVLNVNNDISLSINAVCGLAPAAGSGNATVLNLAGTISGNGAMRRTRIAGTGAGTVMLSGANIFSGGFVHVSDSVVLNNKAALGIGTYTIGDPTVLSGAAVNISANSALTSLNAVANAITIKTNFTWSGAADLEFSGPVTLAMSPTITVSSSAASIFSGGISGTGFGFTKAGTGALTLNGNNTYTGATLVNAGTLLVHGTLPNSAVTVATTGTLGGDGTIGSLVTVQSGGNLAPGASIGTLTLSTAPSLSGTVTMEINRSGLVLTSDKLVLTSGTLTYGGQLTVTLAAGSDPLLGGNTFTLFAAPAFNGSFSGFNLPTLPAGLAWDTSQLNVNGAISVVCTASPVADAGANKTNCPGGSVQIGGSPTASGGSGGYTYSWSPSTGLSSSTDANPTASPAATTTYTVVVTDSNGCSSTGSSVTVTVDTTAPTITCPTNITVQCPGDVPAPDFAGGTVSDDTDPNPVVTHVSDVTNQISPLIITRTYKATDACTNQATCTQTITVQDTIPPVASCKNITVTLVAGSASITPADVNNGSSDNCTLNLVSVEPNSFTIANAGPNNVTLTVSDNSEHTNTCTAVVTVQTLSTNHFVIQLSDLATTPSDFSPPAGTGTNAFGYDWDSAPPDDAFGAPTGYQDSSFFASVTNDPTGTGPDLNAYRALRLGLTSLFGHAVNVGQVARISYHTKKPAPQSEIDWRLSIYTTPQGAGDAGSFYRSRLQCTPANALNLNAPSNQWNSWATAAGDNELQFKDNRTDFMTEDMLWSDIISGPVTRGASTWDWTAEQVMWIDVIMGANSGGGTGLSQLDGIQIELTTGEVADIDLQQNTALTRYNIEPSDLATSKTQFSPPHGTGTNAFGYDWDSAAPDTAAGAPTNYGCTSFAASVTQSGATEPDRYRTFRIGLRSLFGHNVTVSEVASISYQTLKPTPQTAVDWRLSIYTTPQGAGDAGSFYRSRLQATPFNALNLNAPAAQWNTWSTTAGINEFQFKDNRTDFMTEDMLWSDITTGPVTRGASTWDWTAEEVMMIDITLGANTGGGDATSQLDAVRIRLSDGTIADINLDALPYSSVYVDDDYTGLPDGTAVAFPNGVGAPTHTIGCDAFATIQGGINAVATGGTVNVAAGSYHEDVNVDKTVSVSGAGAGQSVVSGVTNGGTATFQVTAAGVLLEGFTITRDGNNPTDWNGPLNTAGVAIQGLTANATVRNCWFEGNRTAIDINHSDGNVIGSNVMTNNRTGIIFRNDCQNNSVSNNAIVDNWTVGVLWLDTGISGLAQGTVLSGNNISGNWYGQIVDRRTTAGTFDLWNCSGNWLGSSTLVITSADSGEPGYAALIPVAFGGSAVPPGGAPTLAGPGVANIDYTPWLNTGTDTSIAFAFQGDFSTLHVDDNSPQVGATGRIQEGVNRSSGSTVFIAAGTYTENVVISSNVSLLGAGSGTGAGDTIIIASNTSLPVILIDDAGGAGTGDRLTLKDLRVQGSTGSDGVQIRATTAPRAFYRLDNVASVQNPNGAGLQVTGPQSVSDIEVNNSLLDNNNYGVLLATSLPTFNGLLITGGEIKTNSTSGLLINPAGTDATDPNTDYSNITVDGTAFANNGNAIFAGSGHLVFFRFNGNATVKNVTLSGPTWSPIQFRGEGVDATPATWQPSGTVLLQNVTIAGSGIRPGLYIQDYSAVSGFTIDNVNLGSYMPPDVSGPNGFFAQAMQVRHTGAVKMNLGSLTLPSTVTFSGFTPVSGYYALAMAAPGGAQATCNTLILGANTTQALEDAVFDADDTNLMAALSIPPGSIGDVTFPALSVTCPGNVTQGCAPSTGATVTFPPASATGDCSPGTAVCNPPSGSLFPLGNSIVTCSVTDSRGVSNTCTFTVTVLPDTNAPVITCPPGLTVQCDQSLDPTNTGSATATDDCDATPVISHVDSAPVEVTASTLNGWAFSTTDGGTPPNTATSELVNGPASPPLGTGSAHLAVGTNGNAGAQLRTTNYNGMLLSSLTELRYKAYRAVDGSGGQGVYVVFNIDLDGDGVTDDLLFFEPEYQRGTYNPSLPVQGPLQTGVWQSWDALVGGWWSENNNAGAGPGADVKSLATYLAAFPTARIAVTPLGAVRLVAGFGAGAWDNFDGNADEFVIGFNGVSTVYDFDLAAGGACQNTVIARTWTATDSSSNQVSCTQEIRVVDTTAPVITCSTNIAAATDPGQCGAVVSFVVTAQDNCDATPVLSSTPASGSLFPVGITTVTNVATDACGNTTTCTFTVTVSDTEPPAITCPTNITVAANAGMCSATNVDLGLADATDNCGIASVTNDGPAVFLAGSTPVVWTALDVHGNTSTCTQLVTVLDTQPPVIVCSTNRIVEATSPAGTPVFFATTATDNCSSVSIFCSKSSGDPFPLGITTVNCAAYDASLNASVCFFDVTVIDTTPPVITCPTNMTVGCNRTNGAVVDFTVGASDLGDSNVIVTADPPSGSTFPPGTTTVNCTAADHSGHTNVCSFTITVVQMPVLLSIKRDGTNVVISWPVTCTPYELRETPNLNSPINWAVSSSPVVSNLQNIVTLPHGGTNRFFRLQQQ